MLNSCENTEKPQVNGVTEVDTTSKSVVLSFTSYTIGEPGASTTVSLADINNDGLPDIVLGNGRHSGGQNGYFLNTGKNAFESMISFGFEHSPTVGIVAGFINDDEYIDLLVGNGSLKTNTLVVSRCLRLYS